MNLVLMMEKARDRQVRAGKLESCPGPFVPARRRQRAVPPVTMRRARLGDLIKQEGKKKKN